VRENSPPATAPCNQRPVTRSACSLAMQCSAVLSVTQRSSERESNRASEQVSKKKTRKGRRSKWQ
jgi:hypothetical protein